MFAASNDFRTISQVIGREKFRLRETESEAAGMAINVGYVNIHRNDKKIDVK